MRQAADPLPHEQFRPKPPLVPAAQFARSGSAQKIGYANNEKISSGFNHRRRTRIPLRTGICSNDDVQRRRESDYCEMRAMMPECSAMMKELMADPIVQKRMMAIMQKHMKQQHSGQGSMMMMPGMAGAKATPSGSAGSESSSHEAHHSAQPAATPTAAAAPLPTASPYSPALHANVDLSAKHRCCLAGVYVIHPVTGRRLTRPSLANNVNALRLDDDQAV